MKFIELRRLNDDNSTTLEVVNLECVKYFTQNILNPEFVNVTFIDGKIKQYKISFDYLRRITVNET